MGYLSLSNEIKIDFFNFISEKDCIQQYNIIISDTELAGLANNKKFENTYKNIQWKNIVEAMSYYLSEETYTNILLILENNPLDSLISLLIKSKKNITILDLHSWVFSHGEKSYQPHISEYSMQDYGFDIFSPVDIKSFQMLLQDKKTSKRIITIPDIILPEDLIKDEKLPIVVNYEVEKKINTGIFAVWYSYIQVGQLLQQEEVKDIMLLVSDSLLLNKKALSHIKELKNLVVICDSKYPEIIKKNIQSQLYQERIFDLQLSIITPNYDKLTTILKDYQLQETEFDTEGLAKKLFA